jgi:hypothetical protein
MNSKMDRPIMILFAAAILLFSGCTPGPTAVPASKTPAPARAPTTASAVPASNSAPTAIPLPALSLKPGDPYFSLDGRPGMIFVRNITGKNRQDFADMLDWAHKGGTRLVRVHLTSGWWGDPWINQDGTVDENWAQDWEWFFDQAQADGIYVMPVFGVWYDWNNNTPDLGEGGLWKFNTLNQANGGPLQAPGEIFQPGSQAHDMWMAWVRTLVERWQNRRNILAWEIFSEINIASGAPGATAANGSVTAASAIDFTNEAAELIHMEDASHRPLTLSLAGGSGMPITGRWVEVYKLDALDFIQIHPYTDKLDRMLLEEARNTVTKYGKPVLVGESGLAGNLAYAPHAAIGIDHSIWAAVVSGAMDARSLWWEDGNEFLIQPDRALAMQFMQPYATAELPAARFVSGIDFTGFKPLAAASTDRVWGAALGNESSIIGWYRDAACEPSYWNLLPVISGQTVTIRVPGSSVDWKVDFYDTRTGKNVISSAAAVRNGDSVTVALPDFSDEIAFRMTAVDGAVLTPALKMRRHDNWVMPRSWSAHHISQTRPSLY